MTADANLFPQSLRNESMLPQLGSADASQRLSEQANAPEKTAPPPADTPQDKIDKVFLILGALPPSFQLSHQDFLKALSAAGLDSDPGTLKILEGVTSVSKQGNHIELHRDKPTEVVFNQDVIKGLFSIKSLDLGSLSFDLNVQGQSRQVDNIQGLSLTMTEFGHDQSVRVQQAKLASDRDGNSIITGMIENPIPPQARAVLDIADKIPVSFALTKEGNFQPPLASTVLKSAADLTGPSLPGLVLHDELQDASDVARFAEKYPKWMSDTVTPVLTGLEKVVEENQKNSANAKKDSHPSAKTEPNTVEKPAGKVVTQKSDRITAGGDFDKTIKVDGEDRHYILHVPKGYDGKKPLPLVVALHGMGGSSEQMERQSKLNETADKDGFIIAYPDSTQWFGQKDWKTWDTGDGIIPPGKHTDDIKFLRAVMDDVQSQTAIDDRRIYLAGISNGGMMTYHAAAALSDKVAAIAVISGAMSGKEASPNQPISVLNIHGTNDTVIPIGGVEGVPDSLTQLGIPTFKPNAYVPYYWNIKDGINAPAVEERVGNEVRDHYTNPKDGAEVEQIVVNGGEHVPDNIGQTMDTVWQFFKRHPKIAVTADNVPPANEPVQIVHTPVDPVERLQQDVKKRGVKGIEADADKLLAVLPTVADGSISPAEIYKKVDDTIHQNFNDPISALIKTTDSLSKSGDHYTIKRADPMSVPIDFKVPATNGIVTLKDFEIGDSSFDLHNKDGLSQIDNVKGLAFKTSVFGHDFTSQVKELKESKSPDGNHVYSLKISHPLPTFARFLLMQPDNISVDVALDGEGNPQVTNQKQIMDDALGRNPLVRGVIDEVTDVAGAVSHPSLSSFGSVLKDVAITGGATFLAGKLGFVAAPAIIHEVDQI